MVENQPIKYLQEVEIRISDLDVYGHVNSKHYIDLVSTARLIFLKEKMQVSIDEIAAKGIGFFLTKSTINYLRPITGLQRVVVESYVGEIRDAKFLIVPFHISSRISGKVFSEGVLEFAIIDMPTRKPTLLPEWVKALFFE